MPASAQLWWKPYYYSLQKKGYVTSLSSVAERGGGGFCETWSWLVFQLISPVHTVQFLKISDQNRNDFISNKYRVPEQIQDFYTLSYYYYC